MSGEYDIKYVNLGAQYSDESSVRHMSRNVALGIGSEKGISPDIINGIYDSFYFSNNLNPYMVTTAYIYYYNTVQITSI